MSSRDELQSRITRVLDTHSRSSDLDENDDGSVDCFCGWVGYHLAEHQAEKLVPVVQDWAEYWEYLLDTGQGRWP
jgi:hypothetical protein